MSRTPGTPPAAPDAALIFLHVPKTAGVTLNTLIDRHYSPEAIYQTHIEALDDFFALTDAEKQPIRCLRGHMPFGLHAALPRPATYLTLLREPVARFVSEYTYIRTSPDHSFHEHLIANDVTLEAYIEIGEPNLMTRWLCGFAETGDWLPNPLPADAVATAQRHLAAYFSVAGLTERFDEFLLLLRRVHGWRRILYTRQNVTRARRPHNAIPRATLAAIAQANREDIALYAHAKAQFDAQVRAQGLAFQVELRLFRLLNRLYADVSHRRRLRTVLRRGAYTIRRLPARIARQRDAK
ncbi:MAG: sulfotransferase family 2 domain-containing protein [Anaerolineae bacterium]|nr:sulfotransferase family 2 domain-containing protein [Anaerolineae bacterium]